MAKSLRSKRERKLRAVKRKRYGVKELERLKKTVENDPVRKQKETIAMLTKDTCTMTSPSSTVDTNTEAGPSNNPNGTKHKFNKKTMKDQHGNYPVWMHQRKINKMKRKSKKGKTSRKK